MTNAQRRQIVDEAKARGYEGSYVDLFNQQSAAIPQDVAQHGTPKSMDGLRPAHQAGNTEASMAFTDVPPNTPFNTVGMRAPIDIKKYDEQGHLVKSYESVPPGIQSLDTGPSRGTVIETPARMQEGGLRTESLAEDLLELTPGLGTILSLDDAYYAAKDMFQNPGEIGFNQRTFSNALDIIGLAPGGKVFGAGVGRAMNLGNKIVDISRVRTIDKAVDVGSKLGFADDRREAADKNIGTVLQVPKPLKPRPPKKLPRQGGRQSFQEGGFDESGNPIAYLSAIDLENYMSENRGNTPEFWKATADTIAYHENAIPMTGSMSLTRPQIGGGPGRGLFQFESKDNPDKDAFETAKQRYVNVSKVMPGYEPDPAIVNAKSAAELDKEQQYALFHANLIEGPAKLANYAEGKMDIEDLWLKGHKGVEKKGDRESFDESRQAAKKDNLSKYGLRFGGVRYSNSRYRK